MITIKNSLTLCTCSYYCNFNFVTFCNLFDRKNIASLMQYFAVAFTERLRINPPCCAPSQILLATGLTGLLEYTHTAKVLLLKLSTIVITNHYRLFVLPVIHFYPQNGLSLIEWESVYKLAQTLHFRESRS